MVRDNQLQFNTAIITYPSDYDGLLCIGLIVDKFQSICKPTTKILVAREDPDEEIQRIHYHCYYDDDVRKNCTTKYFDIKLPEPVLLFVKKDKTREYRLLSTMASELGWDTGEEMVAKLETYVKYRNEDLKDNPIVSWDTLDYAHPNIQLKKEYYGDKYCMLKYVVKQKLVARSNFNLEEELEYLKREHDTLLKKVEELTEKKCLKEIKILTVDELITLGEKYLKKQQRKKLTTQTKRKRGRKSNRQFDDEVREFVEELRLLVLQRKITQSEIMNKIKNNPKWWYVYCKNVINYRQLINDMFKTAPPCKPKRNYNTKFWLPRKLHSYIMWLDDWVRRYTLGEKMESRPKGLVLIGPSRTGKTTLMSLIGDFSYIKNVWNVDNWEGSTAFTIMDDMDAGDEGKGLSFCWYKPFFGAQDAVTVTDKFKPKRDIYNGKPLIWINNYDYTETFQSKTAQDYIKKNMEIVYIYESLFEPKGEWIEGHSDYIEFDPKTTWYFQNIVCQTITCPKCQALDYLWKDSNQPGQYEKELQQWKCNVCKTKQTTNQNKDIEFIDETQSIIEKYKELDDDLEPLSERKKRLEFENEKGRPSKRIRTENTSM